MADPPQSLRRTRPPWRTDRVLVAGVAVLVAAPYAKLVSVPLYFALIALAAWVCVQRAAAEPRERAAWLAFGIGIAVWAATGVGIQLAYGGQGGAPAPNPGDPFYLVSYVCLYAGLGLLVRARLPGRTRSLALDGTIGGTAVAALVAAIALPRLAEAADVSTALLAVNIGWAAADVLLLGLLVGACTLARWRDAGSWGLLGAGLVLLTVADVAYAYDVATGTYEEGTWFDLAYLFAFVCVALAAWRPLPVATPRRQTGVTLAVPAGLAALAIGLLAYGNVRSIGSTAVALACASVLAAGARVALTFRERLSIAATKLQAITDDLTGLPNRRLLYRELERAVGTQGPLAFAMIDLDGFKELNDTLGHRAGDDVLRRVGARLAGAVPAGGVLGRLGGDEFGLILPGATASAAARVADGMREALEPAFEYDGLRLEIGASAGIACFPDDGGSADELIQHADTAMYAAKRRRTGVERYAPARDARSRERLELVGELRDAIEQDALALHFQPQGEPRGGAIPSVEALVRWPHPERGLLAPGAFLPAAQRTTLMRPLTLRVLDRALAQAAAWAGAGTPRRVAVNLDVANLIDRQLPADVAAGLARHAVPAELLVLEITERVMMADPERSAEVLAALAQLGVGLSLDDFGHGETSLGHLRRLPLSEVKIDRSLVAHITADAAAAVIVEATIRLGHALGLRVVAEGAEDVATWRRLGVMGCDLVQGYVLCRPLPPEELDPWLAGRAHARAAA